MSSNVQQVVEQIRGIHRRRRYWMRVQQKIDRAMEAFVRRNHAGWNKDLTPADREKANKKALELIKRARENKDDDAIPFDLFMLVDGTDKARAEPDKRRIESETEMERLAKSLPIYGWCEDVRGVGALGLATIIAEVGDLANYDNPGKLWSRLGFAPFEGFAGSSWKRDKWRPRALTAEEWKAHPFSGERYALMHQIAVWLVNAQVEGKEKSGTKHGKAKGPYGELYIYRRNHTDEAHPDWTPMHGRMDALRYVMKRFLKDLWMEWNRTAKPSFVYRPHPKDRARHDAEMELH